MEFDSEKIDSLFDVLTTNGEKLEIEAKVRTLKNGVKKEEFYRLMSFLDGKYNKKEYRDVIEIYDDDLRHISLGKREYWEKKITKKIYNLPNYNIKFTASTEKIYEELIPQSDPKVERKRYRVSFNTLKTKIELTIINGKFYEVEVEYMDDKKEFLRTVMMVYGELLGTKILYTNKEKELVSTSFRNLVLKDGPTKPRNLKKYNIMYGGLVGNPRYNYSMSWKADGVRKFLYFGKIGAWLIYGNSFNLIARFKTPPSTEFCFDGEYIQKPKKDLFVVFDIVYYGRMSEIKNAKYEERYKNAKRIVENLKLSFIDIMIKKVVFFKTVNQFYENIDFFLDNSPEEYKTDGLIFTPNDIYNTITIVNSMPLSNIYKWKPPERLTIDFKIVKINGEMRLFSYSPDGDIPFYGIKSKKIENITYADNDIVKDGDIGEFSWNEKEQIFELVKIRTDKSSANHINIARDVFNDIINPITADYLRGNILKVVSTYHKKIKRDLIKYETKPGNLILDIGTGAGGDLRHYSDRKLIAVEPNQINRKRLYKLAKDDTLIIPYGGEDTLILKTIIEEKYSPGTKVDVISFMLSLSFFWKSEEMFEMLMQTIKYFLKPGGKIIFLTIDGNCVEQVFNPTFGEAEKEKELKLLDLRIVNEDDHLKLYFPEYSIVKEQKEYYVFLGDMLKNLESSDHNFNRAETERLLTNDAKKFTSLYRFGTIKVGENDEVDLMKIKEKETYKPLKDNYVAISCIKDNSSILHCILKSTSENYQQNNSINFRKLETYKLRKELASMVNSIVRPETNFSQFELYYLEKYYTNTEVTIESVEKRFSENEIFEKEDFGHIAHVLDIRLIIVNEQLQLEYANHTDSLLNIVLVKHNNNFSLLAIRNKTEKNKFDTETLENFVTSLQIDKYKYVSKIPTLYFIFDYEGRFLDLFEKKDIIIIIRGDDEDYLDKVNLEQYEIKRDRFAKISEYEGIIVNSSKKDIVLILVQLPFKDDNYEKDERFFEVVA